jgi:glucans biosynthesis protein
MDQPRLSHLSPLSQVSQVSRCGAKTRAGSPCRRPPVQGRKRCRLHGGLSPGAPRGSRNGNYTDGGWTAEAIEERKWLRSLVRAYGVKGHRP